MQDYEKLRAWAKRTNTILRERVLDDGQHHIWLSVFPGCRVDRAHRDFAFCAHLVWNWVVVSGFDELGAPHPKQEQFRRDLGATR